MNKHKWVSLLAAALLAACASVTNPVSGQRELTVMDEKSEIAAGAKAHQEVLKEYGVVDDAALQAYVDGVGQKLAAKSQRAQLKWSFTVLDSPQINAFALPGGYIYITRGLMAYLDNEAELAGVLGHEIGHVTARHGAQQATRQTGAAIGVGLAAIGGAVLEAATGVSGIADIVGGVAQAGAAGLIASYSRDQELQADQLGAEYLARNRYDPAYMVEVIQVLKDQERYAAEAAKAAGRAPPAAPGWLASHPSNDQRLQQIRASARQLAGATGAAGAGWDDPGHDRYLKAVDGMSFGDSRAQGVVRGRQFFHEPLGVALTAPPGWRIVNDSEQLMLIDGARDAALVMQVVPAEVVRKSGGNHAAILRQALGATDGRTETLTLGGNLQATHFVGRRRDRNGNSGPLDATLVNGPGAQVFLLGRVGRDAAALQRAAPALREAELSFRAMTAADRRAARPWQLKLVPFPAGGFAALARSSPLTELPQQQLRLLNGVYGGEAEPPTGRLVKVVQ
ncbi:MAG TPA: M48 family metalloprotease [Rubrivivax sp.]|nr:M48 family metalloprotease [Rubrivivax sp.]